VTARDVLWDRAIDQHGFITRNDADEAGVSPHALDMLVYRGQVERVAMGVYRFPQYPVGPNDHYMLAVLWTGEPRACLSHETALAVYELSDVNPDRIHMTVPKARRIRRSGGELYVVHREDLPDDAVDWWDEIPTVTAATAIRQCIDTGMPSYLVRQALTQGAERGRLRPSERIFLEQRLETRGAG
jgi:predicted transcriptional regulator of viral defense system